MSKELFTIMIVEDEGLVAKDLEARLQQTGYNIAGIADNFDDAINLFKKKLPDLVLLDITIKGKLCAIGSRLGSICVKKAWAGKHVINLTDTIVNGDVVFEGITGSVLLRGNAHILGNVIGGSVKRI